VDRSQVPCAAVDQGRLRPAHRMRGELPCVKTDAGNPTLHQARVLPRRQRPIWAASARKQNLPRFATAAAQIRVERLRCLLGQFEPHRPTGLPLARVGAVHCVAVRRQSSTRDATRSHPRNLLSIARLKRAKSRSRSSRCNLARMDQTCPGRSGGLGPIILPLFHGDRELPVLDDGSRAGVPHESDLLV
jgi:hypothetical protein